MGRREVNIRAMRNDSIWINGRVTSIIVLLDVIHVHCAAHARNLEDLFCVIEQVWVLSQQFLVAFEVNSIYL